jgi:putative ABC transport system permease protein
MKFRRNRKEADLHAELQFHLDEEAAERAASGVPEAEARYAARRDLGNLALVMEDTRAAWGWTFWETLRQDVRFALRSLRHNSGFSLLVVLILGLGIGANTAVFSVVNSVVLQPLGYSDADRLVTLSSLWKSSGPGGNVSVPDFHDWHDQSSSFEAMASYSSGEIAVVTGPAAEFAREATVSQEFFKVFGVEPVLGRFFSGQELKPGSSGAAMVSYAFWQIHYNSDPAVLTKKIRMANHVLPIVGVLPPGFRFPGNIDIWVPANTIFPQPQNRSAHNLRVVAKLKPGATVEQAQAEMTAIGNRLEAEYPKSNRDKNVAVAALRDDMLKDARTMLYLLWGAVAMVLLVACGNVANLLLAKASTRGREIAVRAAIGASRMRIVRQLLTESLLVALLAGGVGVLIALAGSRDLVALAPGNIPRLADTHIDGWVLGFAFAASVLACLLFGLAPAFRAARVDVNEALKAGAARGVVGARSRLRSGLVVAEIALSVMLVAGAGLLLRSFAALHQVALGFHPENVLVMETSMTASLTPGEAIPLYKRLLGTLASVPGVTAVGATRVPPGEVLSDGAYFIDWAPTIEQITVSAPQAVYSVVSPGAFAALGIPLKRGRDFQPSDTPDAPFVAVINEKLAARAFAGRDPIGHTIVAGLDSLKPMTIVGVVGDIRQRGPVLDSDAEIYMPYEQHPIVSTQLRIVARTILAPEQLAKTVRHVAREIAPETPLKFTTMQARMSENLAAPRFRTLLLTIFGVLAVTLAMAGIYAVMSFLVNQRTGEIGLRMALGARSGDVLRMVLARGIWLAAAGLALGLIGSLAAARLLSTMLFGVTATDPTTYAAVIVLVGVIALAASYLPARRAAHIDPLAALRQE